MTVARPAPSALEARPDGVRLRDPLLVGGAALAALVVVGTVDPYQEGHYPTCPFLSLTGMYCPGCGSLRALHDLAHGELGSALARNPLAVVAVAGLLVAYAQWTRRNFRGEPRRWLAPPWLLHALLGGVLAFGVLRNVPGWTWLSPA